MVLAKIHRGSDKGELGDGELKSESGLDPNKGQNSKLTEMQGEPRILMEVKKCSCFETLYNFPGNAMGELEGKLHFLANI